jgi:ABC-2 type transport system ATP-binding protein
LSWSWNCTTCAHCEKVMIEIEALTRRFGKSVAVESLTLQVRAGEIFGFLGPNGAGKTTTIKLIAGLLRPSAGIVRLAGIDVARDPVAAKALLGYVPDTPHLYEKLTPGEFLRFVGRLWRMDGQEVERKIEHYLGIFQLLDRRGDLIEGLSHGMRQKVAIAAALLHSPRLLVVDEPMVGMDPLGSRVARGLLREHARTGGTVFLSTHDLQLAEEICDRVGLIRRGKLVALGTMSELQQLAASGSQGLEDIFLELTAEAEQPGASG